jgi:L-fucose isomerase-like protein
MMKKLRIGYVCLARLTFDGAYANDIFARSLKALAVMDVDVVHAGGLTVTEKDAGELADQFCREQIDVMLVQCGTFPTGTLMPILAQKCPAPIILWGVPEPTFEGKLRSNSFCGVNMNAHTLMRLERKYDYVFCLPEKVGDEIATLVRVFRCLKRLRETRFGLVGYRVPGFYPSLFDEMGLRRLLGVEAYHVTLLELVDLARGMDRGLVAKEVEAIRKTATACKASDEEIDKMAALVLAFQQIAERYGLTGFAIKCWPEFAAHYGIMPCATISRLNDLGLLASCEGDMYGVVTMLIGRELSGATPMFSDFIAGEEDRNVGLGWHCGAAPTRIAEKDAPIILGKHPTAGGGNVGVNVTFPVRAGGPASVARLSTGPKGLRLFFAGGKAVAPRSTLAGNTFAVQFDSNVRHILDVIIRNGLEHHYVFLHADIRPELRVMARWLDLETLDVDAGEG